MTTKVCARCKERKPTDDFRPDPQMRCGLGSWCKPCCLSSTREWRARNAEQINARRRKTAVSCKCVECGTTFESIRPRLTCTADCKKARDNRSARERMRGRYHEKTHKSRHQVHRRRTAKKATDLTAGDIALLLAGRTYCPLCRKRMSSDHRHPHAKHLDHIVPIGIGGTHSHGNVRVICRTCNLGRPNDGSDINGQVTLWAQDVSAAPRIPVDTNQTQEREQRKQQQAEDRRYNHERRVRALAMAEAALAMRKAGQSWQQVADALGYIGRSSARNAVMCRWPDAVPRFWARPTGSSIATIERQQARYSTIVQLRSEGRLWREIADDLGYANARSVQKGFRDLRRALDRPGAMENC